MLDLYLVFLKIEEINITIFFINLKLAKESNLIFNIRRLMKNIII